MSKPDLAVSGRLFVGGEFRPNSAIVAGEKIVDILPTSEVPSSVDQVDFGDLWVLPGLIDVHVHLRDFKEVHKEDFESGTKAAVAGGFSTVLAMPNTNPRLDSAHILSEAVRSTIGRIYCDVGFHCALPISEDDALRMMRDGAFSVKLYPENLSEIREGETSCDARLLKRLGPTLYVHAEDEDCIREGRASVGASPIGASVHGRVRPPRCEAVAIKKTLSELEGCDIHFAHLTTREGVDLLGPRLESKKTSAEATAHHLVLSDAGVSSSGGLAKVNPPLRSAGDVEAIRKAVNRGLISVIVSDHAPHALAEKRERDYDRIPPGGPGLETALSAMLKLAHDGQLELVEALMCMTENPARRFGLNDVGRIGGGFLADFTVVDPKQSYIVDPERFFSKAKYSLFEGKELLGRVRMTMVRGRIAYEDGYVARTPNGRALRRCRT